MPEDVSSPRENIDYEGFVDWAEAFEATDAELYAFGDIAEEYLPPDAEVEHLPEARFARACLSMISSV